MTDELVLAFDADCHRCRAVAAEVRRRVGDAGLEVLPLRDYRVQQWRAEVYGADPPHAPTLLAVTVVDGVDQVRAWHGPAVVAGLLRTLGARRTAALAPVVGTLLRKPSPARGA
ncbi:hypothetical protein [Actinomycetospora corticicola]|uniref:Putative DCC family thiol-disulfide oxidoreductase YuxK n=1 Tax=Actinomycetospora corticicola TaxID=663602 RepID=A0A7Y9DUV1_9PSEU|nr:hypothetical protein [Actinomycetospora corticicola]NYD35854.1 putative DCC family thiol-disulfide oxidoreductase YuxK [Actinomycetospora corticicola]